MDERTVSARMGFEGRLLKVEVVDVELATGQRAVREIVRHPGAAVVLARLPDGRFVLVRQFRKAIETDLLEAVAGTLGPGEDPLACAQRELREETGYEATRLVKLGVVVPAPGYTDEKLHVYYAELDDRRREACPDDDEKVSVEVLEAEALEAQILDGEIGDAKTLAAWLLYKRKVATHVG